jgi:hypothetical protein
VRRRSFRPRLCPLEGRSLLTTALSPWLPATPIDPGSHSGARLTEGNGLAVLQGSSNGDAITASDAGPGLVAVEVDNPRGSDTFLIPASDVLEVIGGAGPNAFESSAGDTTIFIGGTGDNLAVGGSGFTFLCSIGSGENTFTAGSGYTCFVAASSGSTTMHGGGAFNSASLCLGVNDFQQGDGTASAVYCYGGGNTIDVAPTGDVDVFWVTPTAPTVNNPSGNPGVRLHPGLF